MTARQVAQRALEGPPWTLRRVPDAFELHDYTEFDLRPLSPTIGAEVTGIKLSNELPAPARAQLQRALLEWKVLFFRAQPMSEPEFLAFGRTWGQVVIPAMTKHREIPEVQELTKGPESRGEENIWHSDQPWKVRPPALTILRALTVPQTGGDTLFADMAAAYDDLPDETKARVRNLRAENVHPVLAGVADYGPAHSLSDDEIEERRQQYPPQSHPVIRTHPETGRQSIFVDITHTTRIYDVAPEVSEELMDLLVRRATFPEYQCRFRWSNNSLVMWDNRTVQHYAVSDYWPHTRVMQRMTIEGEQPE